MIYKCTKCQRVYNKRQLIRVKTMESNRINHFELRCPLCKDVNVFELQKEIYTKIKKDITINRLKTIAKEFREFLESEPKLVWNIHQSIRRIQSEFKYILNFI